MSTEMDPREKYDMCWKCDGTGRDYDQEEVRYCSRCRGTGKESEAVWGRKSWATKPGPGEGT